MATTSKKKSESEHLANAESCPSSTQQRKHPNGAQILEQRTFGNDFHYLHLARMTIPQSNEPVDEPTTMLELQAALKQFLGLTGTAIPVDILKLEEQHVWIRVPRPDSRMVISALSSWMGGSQHSPKAWRILGSSDWLLEIVHGGSEAGRSLFED